MSTGATSISDLVMPELFSPYAQQLTLTKSSLIRSGVLARDKKLDALLAGGGLVFTEPANDTTPDDYEGDNVSSDDYDPYSNPDPYQSYPEKATADPVELTKVRLSRNNSWGFMDLASDLSGANPMRAVANRVSDYWSTRLQDAVVATVKGVFAQNALPVTAMYFQNDLTHDVSGVSYADGVSNFGAGAFVDALETIGDQMQSLKAVMVHPTIYARMLKKNLVTFEQIAVGTRKLMIPTVLGREVIVDDSVPVTGGVFESWLFGAGALNLGVGAPKVPTEIDRAPATGNGGGQDILHNRVEWIIHPEGHAYVGIAPKGGPSNAATANNLAHADSWKRAIQDRKRIKIARLITREF